MKQIFLTRHGLSEANREHIVQGQSDYPLSQEGRTQSLLLARYFSTSISTPTSILASPLMRARETAEIIAEHCGCAVEYDNVWMERRLGKAQGTDSSTVRSWLAKDSLPSSYDPIHGDGESWMETYIRAGQALLTLMDRLTGTYIVVSHGGFLNAVLRVILGIAPAGGRIFPPSFVFSNSGFAQVEYDEEFATWQVVRLNATPHLDTKTD